MAVTMAELVVLSAVRDSSVCDAEISTVALASFVLQAPLSVQTPAAPGTWQFVNDVSKYGTDR